MQKIRILQKKKNLSIFCKERGEHNYFYNGDYEIGIKTVTIFTHKIVIRGRLSSIFCMKRIENKICI